jgi:hypothetical protein
MQALTNTAMLAIWERGRHRDPAERALVLLGAAMPATHDDDCARMTIGERNAAVLALRRATFGPELASAINCPRCGEMLELELDAAALPAAAPRTREISVADGRRFRLPDSRDLVAAGRCASTEDAAQMLLQRCCLEAAGVAECSVPLIAEVERAMAAVADAADIELGLTCAACGHAWSAPFDICGYFWEEIEQRVAGLLDDVHRLACVYGWDEQQILAMSDARRAAYLERCDA